MPHRYFTTEIGNGIAALTGADAHHLSRVMRAKIGDEVILCGDDAMEYTACITSFGEERVEFSIDAGAPSAAEPSVDVTVFAGYPKQDKLEQIIKHGTELGAVRFVPFFSRYCVAAPKKEEQKNVRYNRIALEAAKQSGRGIVPTVAMPLENFGAVCRSFANYDLVLFCYEGGGVPLRTLLASAQERHAHAAAQGANATAAQAAGNAEGMIHDMQQAPHDGASAHPQAHLKIALVTGAEGGFSEKEVADATAAGAQIIGLGARILRCETAPLAALSAILAFTENLE